MAVVKISAIYEFFQSENAKTLIKKGEKSEESKRVLKHMYDGTVGIIKAHVQASQKQQQYSVEIHLQDMYPPSKVYQALGRPVSDEDINFLRDELKNLNRFTGMYWLLQKEPSTSESHSFPTIQTIVESSNTVEEVLEKMKLIADQIQSIAKLTVQQRESTIWHEMRLGRLTASNFGAVLQAVERNRYPKSLFSRLLGKANLDGVKSIQWGIHHEEDARKTFESATGMTVTPTGLWLHPSGILGASPDGLVGDNAILEVKCPFSHRNSTREEMQADEDYCLDGDGLLKTTHTYYHQVQGQLHLLQRSICYFVVWTTKTVAIVIVNRDPSWENNIQRLINFYKTHLLPKLME